jgi:hypothetical protein
LVFSMNWVTMLSSCASSALGVVALIGAEPGPPVMVYAADAKCTGTSAISSHSAERPTFATVEFRMPSSLIRYFSTG